MKIGTVSKETGLGIHAIRYYEKQGLIKQPEKDTSGHRVYSPKDVELLDWVSCMKNSGMPLSKIREYSEAFYSDNGSACLTLLKDHLALLNEKKRDILHYVDVTEKKISKLNRP